MRSLIIRHERGSDPPRCRVVRLPDGTSSEPSLVPSPVGYPVEGRPDSDLLRDLRWYLEHFLDLPTGPYEDLARRILGARNRWGTELFAALFAPLAARRAYDAATAEGFKNLRLQIVSDDPGVLGWPWEALCDPEAGLLAQECLVERRLESDLRDPLAVPDDLPRDRLRILLVTARPYESDVAFRSVSLPLVDLIEKEHLPAEVTVLRPPTLQALDWHLGDHPGQYHLVHFDGHGSYGPEALPEGNSLKLGGAAPVGRLVFEREEAQDGILADPVTGADLAGLLRKHRIPAVVLNACQSAMIDETAQDPFASVAASLVKAGVRDVVAMSHSLWVSAAREFLPAFYGELFRTGEVGCAVSAGRRRLLLQKKRQGGSLREHELEDWHIPVHYRNDPQDDRLFSFLAGGASKAAGEPPAGPALPEEAADKTNPYGLIGRDGAVLALERVLRARPAGILLHGIGGVGKTTLAKGFLRWLANTDGLDGAFWFRFDESRRSAASVLGEIGMQLFGTGFGTLATDQQLQALERLKEHRFLIVWDNFEVVRGIPGTGQAPTIEGDADLLRRLLEALRGGKTKVLITSRSEEEWLGSPNRQKITLGGLRGEERWAFCKAIADDLGLTIRSDDKDFDHLLDALDGHPLAMRVLLPLLESRGAAELEEQWRHNMAALQLEGDEKLQRQLYGTLAFVEERLPQEMRPLLVPLALHESHVDGDLLADMAAQVDGAPDRPEIDALLDALARAGLLRHLGQSVHAMHPALAGWLRATILRAAEPGPVEAWTRAFVHVMAGLANAYAPKELHDQRAVFTLLGPDFHYARQEARRLGLDPDYPALTQAMAAWALNVRDLSEAERLYTELAQHLADLGQEDNSAAAYHQLGTIAQMQRDFGQAEAWYRKALAIQERLGNEDGASRTYHQLGTISQEQRYLGQAEAWYRQALAIKEQLGDGRGAASTYYQLGTISQEHRDFGQAEAWAQKALVVHEKLGDEHGEASAYHQLGLIAQGQRDFGQAEAWYRKSLAIVKKLGDEQGAAMTYHQLGMIAQEQRDFGQAEAWYRKSLAIVEKLGDEHSAAITYHQLGNITQMQRDFVQAEAWHNKSLAIKEKLGDVHGAASTYHQLGIIAQDLQDFAQAEVWYRRSLAIKEQLGNEHGAAITYHQLGMIAQELQDFGQAEVWYRRSLAIKEKLGNEHGAAITQFQLGKVAMERRAYRQAGDLFLWALVRLASAQDPHGVETAALGFWHLYVQAQMEDRRRLRAQWQGAGIGFVETPPWDEAPPPERKEGAWQSFWRRLRRSKTK